MTRRGEQIVWATAVVLLLVSIVASRTRQTLPRRGVIEGLAIAPLRAFDGVRFDAAAERVVARDPFRLERKPPSVPFGTPPTPAVPRPVPVSPWQAASFRGTVSGPPWLAILGGVPGRTSNVVVHVNDTIAGLRVKQIKREEVVLVGPDSAIKLRLIQSWQ